GARRQRDSASGGAEPASARERVDVVRAAIRRGDEAAGHDRGQAGCHGPPPVPAGRPRRRDELTALLADFPGRLTEQELGTELESDLHRPCALRRKFAVAAIEPAGLPAVGLVRQVVLRARASISAVLRPREGLVETFAQELDGT